MKSGAFSNDMFFVKIGENIFKENRIKGELKNSNNNITWDLSFDIEKSSNLYPLKYLYKTD